VVCLFDTAAGPLAVILVAAIFVAGIDTVWAGTVTPRGRRVSQWHYGSGAAPVHLDRGAELGRFNMGSTVILLTGPAAVQWLPDLVPGARLRMGQAIGRLLTGGNPPGPTA
jgi:phosphatidylserine decarboxylase